MEIVEPQRRRGWFAWLRGSIWTQPGGTDLSGEGDEATGLSANSPKPERPPRQQGKGGSTSKDDGVDEVFQASRRRTEEKRLKRDLPLVWSFLRSEGWCFVNQHSWEVGRPATKAGAGGACGGGGENANGAQQGPMPQAQLPAYLLDHPDLLDKYERWLRALPKASLREEDSDGASDDDWGGAIESGDESRSLDRAPAISGSPGGPGEASAAAAAAAPAPAMTAPPPAPAPSPVPSAAECRARASIGGAQQQKGRARPAAPQGAGTSPSSSRGTVHSRTPSSRASAPGGSGCDGAGAGGGGEGAAGRKSGGGARKSSPPASSSPLALRTRSRGARRRANSAQDDKAAQAGGVATAATTARRNTGAGGSESGGREVMDVEIETPPRARPLRAVSSSLLSSAAAPPAAAPSRDEAHPEVGSASGGKVADGADVFGYDVGGGGEGTAEGVGPGDAAELGGWLRQEEEEEEEGNTLAPSAPWLPPPTPTPRRRQQRRREDVVPSSSRKTKERRKTVAVVARDGVAGRLAGPSGRRAVAAGKRRRSSSPETGPRAKGHGAAGAHDPPPSAKRPRVKLERTGSGTTSPAVDVTTRAGGDGGRRTPPGSTPRRRNPSSAARRRSASGSRASAAGAAAASGEEEGGSVAEEYDPFDPLAPYARIEAETVDDEGLEELLHTEKKEGFLDLRRFRKPGWPRPLRITRLEASHGKRFEDHLRLLLSQKRRVEATVFLRRLVHYDLNPPHLAASLLGGGGGGGGVPGSAGRRGRVACIPAWYQEISSPAASAAARSSCPSGGGDDSDGDIEEVVDLTAREAEVVECLDNDPVECVMTRIVKKEPGVEDAEAAAGAGQGGSDGRIGADWRASSSAAAAAPEPAPGRVKMEVE